MLDNVTPLDAERRGSVENPLTPLSSVHLVDAMLRRWGRVTTSGQTVTPEAALGVSAVFAGIDFIAGTIASLPMHVYRRRDGGREGVAPQSLGGRVERILRGPVNDDRVTSYEWRYQAMVAIMLSPGRAVSFIDRDARGRLVALWPLDPHAVTVERENGRRRYLYREDGVRRVYSAEEVIDLTRMTWMDGVDHVNPLHSLRDVIGLALDLQQYAARYFANGGMPPLSLQGPVGSPEAAQRADEDIFKAVQRANAEGRRFVHMPQGYELKPIGTDPQKGQLVEGRRFQLEEIARFVGLPPVFLHDLTHGTFSNTEQQDLHFVKHTLTRWLRKWEEELNAKFFFRQQDVFVKFNADALLRGDYKARMEGHAIAIQNAIRRPNEVRGLEDLAAAPEGDDLLIQGATVPLGQQPTGAPGAGPPPGNGEEGDDE